GFALGNSCSLPKFVSPLAGRCFCVYHPGTRFFFMLSHQNSVIELALRGRGPFYRTSMPCLCGPFISGWISLSSMLYVQCFHHTHLEAEDTLIDEDDLSDVVHDQLSVEELYGFPYWCVYHLPMKLKRTRPDGRRMNTRLTFDVSGFSPQHLWDDNGTFAS